MTSHPDTMLRVFISICVLGLVLVIPIMCYRGVNNKEDRWMVFFMALLVFMGMAVFADLQSPNSITLP